MQFHMRIPKTEIWLLLIILLALFVPMSFSAGSSFAVAPPPAWILPPPKAPRDKIPPSEEGLGLKHLLYDRQIRVSSGSVDRFFCQSTKVLSSAHLERISKLELEFEPSYQRLVIHYIRIHRGTKMIDALRPKEIKIIQKESELDQQLYNGTLSAVIFINDMRVGDILEYAYSINGLNPIFQDSYSATFYLALYEPVEILRSRLLWPTGRGLYFKNHNTQLNPVIRATGRNTEYLWMCHQVPALTYEDNTPDWFQPEPRVQISEFDSWQQVVEWALPLYAADRSLSPELSRQIEIWRNSIAQPEVRFLAALRFVQDEVRYLGIEMGPHSHMPHSPSVVFARRFGDCKDKSLLLVTILNALKIDAWPALVNTESRQALDQYQPTPLAFNHVIVQARLNNRSYWVDPTVSLQRGGPEQLCDPDYRRALIIKEGGKTLEEIPSRRDSDARTVTKETYTAVHFDAPALLEVVTTYYGEDANEIRMTLAEQTLAELSKSYLNYYSETDPAIISDGLLRVSDDQNTNTLILTEKYRIPDFWNDRSRWFIPGFIQARLTRPSTSRRSTPLAIPHPLDITNIIQVHLPKNAFNPNNDSVKIENIYMQLYFDHEFKRDVLTLQYHLRTHQDHVPVEQVVAYLKDLDQMRETIRFQLSLQRQSEKLGGFDLWLILGIFLSASLILLAVRRSKKLRATGGRIRRSKKKERSIAGDGPETAIRIGAETDASRHLRSKQCGCGKPLFLNDQPPHQEMANFDGRRLLIVHLQCEKCSRTYVVYFEVESCQSR
jgi:transglutaminase-like putative cysteine protease